MSKSFLVLYSHHSVALLGLQHTPVHFIDDIGAQLHGIICNDFNGHYFCIEFYTACHGGGSLSV